MRLLSNGHALLGLCFRCGSRTSIVFLAFFLIQCASVSQETKSLKTSEDVVKKIGVTTLEINDVNRARALTTELWYPAADTAREKKEIYNTVFRGYAARDAPFNASEPLPLLLFSHGSGGTRHDLAWLAEYFTRQGYLVAATTHPGNSFGDTDSITTFQVWNRPQDVSYVLEYLLNDPAWSSRIDSRRIGSIGHSMGGYTVLALAGARYDYMKARAHCEGPNRDPTCDAAPKIDRSRIDYTGSADSYLDPRIRAVMAMAPPIGTSVIDESASGIEIPVFLIAGYKDQLVLPTVHAERWNSLITTSTLSRYEEADHYSFLGECNLVGKALPLRVCKHTGDMTRKDIHLRIQEEALLFFHSSLSASLAEESIPVSRAQETEDQQ
jgi:predicted dienelactone hydrolase